MTDVVKLGDIGHFVSGGTPSRKHPEYYEGTIPWVSTPALNGGLLDESNAVQFITEDAIANSATKILPPHSLMIGIRVGVGKTGVNTVPMCTNQDIVAMTGVDETCWDIRYLSYAVQARSAYLVSQKQGATITGITGKLLKSLYVRRLDIETQHDYVRHLDYVKSRIDDCSIQLERLEELTKSRFVEMFGSFDEKGFVPLKDVCSIITDGTHQPPKFYADGIPFLFVSNIANDVLTYETGKYITEEDYRALIKRTPIEVGDVLVSAVGSFGHPAVVREERPFCFQRHIAYLKPIREVIDSDYLHAALLSEHSQRYMDQAAKGVAQRTVTLKSFKELRVPLPPIELQQEFAAIVQQVDKLKFESECLLL